MSEKKELLQEKKERFMEKQKSPVSKIITRLVVAVVIIGGIGWYTMSNISGKGPQIPEGGINIGPRDYTGQVVKMTLVENKVENGQIKISLAAVKKAGIVVTNYSNGGKSQQVLALVTPKGKVVTAISVCEPCGSNRFSIDGDELICDSCGSRWSVETFAGISGGCPDYPPDPLVYSSEEDTIAIDEAPVRDWQPRV